MRLVPELDASSSRPSSRLGRLHARRAPPTSTFGVTRKPMRAPHENASLGSIRREVPPPAHVHRRPAHAVAERPARGAADLDPSVLGPRRRARQHSHRHHPRQSANHLVRLLCQCLGRAPCVPGGVLPSCSRHRTHNRQMHLNLPQERRTITRVHGIRLAMTESMHVSHERATVARVALARLRRERIAAERVRDVGDRLLRADAVAGLVERRRDRPRSRTCRARRR